MLLLFHWVNEANPLAGAGNCVAGCPGHFSSVNGHSFFCRLHGDAKGLISISFKLIEDPLVHDPLHDLVFGYLIGLMPTYATICTYLLYHHCSACSWCSPTPAMSYDYFS